MSLVNDMLRDLEQRNEKPAQVPGNTPQVKAAQYVEDSETPAVSSSRIVLWLIGLIAIGATLWLLWQDYSKKQAVEPLAIKTSAIQSEEQPVKKQIVEPAVQQHVKASAPEVVAVKTAKENIPSSPEVTSEKAYIDKVRWAGTDVGGDLVVTLSDAADIQLLSQDERMITVSFDKVTMETSLPKISSPLIQRLDVNRNDERILLTLTASQPSRFAFRVQQSPTTLILGVRPDQRFISRGDKTQSVETAAGRHQKVTPLDSEANQDQVTSVNSPSSNLETESEKLKNKPEPKPVTKAKRELSDKQVTVRARQLLNKADLAGAEQILRNRIAKHSHNSVEARGLLATLILSTGNYSEAKGVITDGLAIHPQNTGLRKLQSRLLISEGKADQAVSILQSNTPAVVKDPEYYELLASAYQQTRDYERSAKTYYQLLQHSREVPRWWVGMGYALEQSQHYTEARDAYLSALKVVGIDPSLKSYAEQRAKALLSR